MRSWIVLAAAFIASVATAEKAPSAYDGSRDAFLYNGKQNMPFKVYGVAIQWHLDCLKGKSAACLRLAAAFEQGAGDIEPDMRVAIAYQLKGCELGVAAACARSATILRDGSAGFTNADLSRAQAERGCNALKDQASCAALAASMTPGDGRAAALADSACAAGANEGCRIKAASLFYEKRDEASRAKALPMFDEACRAKHAWGCLGLADAYGEGWGVAADKAKAADFARIGCTEAQGDRLRLCTLHGANLARKGSDKAAFNKGELFLDASCRGGDGLACLRIGVIGLNQLSDATTTLTEGLYYLRRGCDLGNGEACDGLGWAYAGGLTRKADEAVALALFDKGCKLGREASCAEARKRSAADPGLRGRISSIDPALPAAEQLRLAKAAAEGEGRNRMDGVEAVVRLMHEDDEDASWLLGGWLKYGLPGIFDMSRQQDALILFENAAKVGQVDAAIYMGMAYWYGDGVDEDRAKGERYMQIAAERGNAMARAIFQAMRNEPAREAAAERARQFEETAKRMRDTWQSSWANYHPTWSATPMATTPTYSGPSVSTILDNANWNQRINYLSGATTACPSYNPYC